MEDAQPVIYFDLAKTNGDKTVIFHCAAYGPTLEQAERVAKNAMVGGRFVTIERFRFIESEPPPPPPPVEWPESVAKMLLRAGIEAKPFMRPARPKSAKQNGKRKRNPDRWK